MSNPRPPWDSDHQGNHSAGRFWPGDTLPAASGPAQAGPAQGGPAQGGPAQAGPAQAGPARGGPARGGPAQAAPTGQQPAGPGEQLRRARRSALVWTAGLLAVALLAAGGTVAGMKLVSRSSPASPRGQAAASAPGGRAAASARQAALLNAALNNADSPGSIATGDSTARAGSGGALAAGAAHRWCGRASRLARVARRAGLPRLARAARAVAGRCRAIRRQVFVFLLLRGVDGQFTFRTSQGEKTLAYERGVIESVSPGSSLLVKASDGTTWTWDLVPATVVRDRSGKVPTSALTSGEPVWVGGPVIQGAKDARLIVIRPPTPTTAPPPGN